MTTTTTLTERYVHEVVLRIPADQRDDVTRELRATIEDTVDARAETADRIEAEREVLAEMGDPVRLAARYADRPLALIGPDLYPSYIRLLRLLLTVVLPVVVAVLVVIDVLEGGGIGSAIGAAVGAVLSVGAQMIAWVTVVYAVIERVWRREGEALVGGWTPEQLPDLREPDDGVGAALASVVWHVTLLVLLVWQHVARPYLPAGASDGEGIEVLDPALWSGWVWPLVAGLVGFVVVELARVTQRRWTVPLAAAYAAAEAVFSLSLAWILYQRMLFNPEFVADVEARVGTGPGELYTVAALAVVVVGVYDVAQRFREARSV